MSISCRCTSIDSFSLIFFKIVTRYWQTNIKKTAYTKSAVALNFTLINTSWCFTVKVSCHNFSHQSKLCFERLGWPGVYHKDEFLLPFHSQFTFSLLFIILKFLLTHQIFIFKTDIDIVFPSRVSLTTSDTFTHICCCIKHPPYPLHKKNAVHIFYQHY